jgi:hypothetical protein
MDDRDRKTILARRRFFIATAVAGLAATQCDNPFRPCLKIAMPVDAGASALPESSVPESSVPEAAASVVDASSADGSSDASADAVADANRPDAKKPTKLPSVPSPQVCLNPYE